MILRYLEQTIKSKIHKGKVIILLGPRQSGKTTLMKKIGSDLNEPLLWLNGDEPGVRQILGNSSLERIKQIIGNYKFVFIDEAQRIENIGLTLKLIVDNIEGVQVFASGSSAFELANKINEPLTGRKWEYFLFPLSFLEMNNQNGLFQEMKELENRLIFGYYPEVVTNTGEDRKSLLQQLTDSYLYKDILIWENIKKPDKIEILLQALAFQLGSEVTFNELSQTTGLDKDTVSKYIQLLEQAYVIFRLRSFSRNLRNELKRSRKIYFYDNGIRNALIANFNPISLRQDLGALWENFLISERMKANHYKQLWKNSWFWRTHTQQEIDYLEEYNGRLFAYEFKWNPKKKAKLPNLFLSTYPDHTFSVINQENYMDFVMSDN
jgi:predicted AAA+ superfamily ATPase